MITVNKVTHDSLPSAVSLLLQRVDELTATISKLTSTPQPEPLTGTKRIATAQQLAKYLKRPISAIYQMEFKGQIKAQRMPNSRKLYFDLDQIDATLNNSNHK